MVPEILFFSLFSFHIFLFLFSFLFPSALNLGCLQLTDALLVIKSSTTYFSYGVHVKLHFKRFGRSLLYMNVYPALSFFFLLF
ncbi:hypothetical protein J3Q64DRAFT_1344577 [Phycomyces blakesleeanus]|uniref:Secreted protein n=1 Tax=Phycomyces blakesleeanus TaxID=4837 RepID=A0ABR3B9V0_PHYBL